MTLDLTRRQFVVSLAASAASPAGSTFADATGAPPEIARACNDPEVDAAAVFRKHAASYSSWRLPPGTYFFKSRLPPVAPVVYQNSTCFLIVGLQHFRVYAHGCTFVIDDRISGPDANHLNSSTSHIGFQGDCKHCAWEGGVIVGNRTGLPKSQVNNGIWASSVTDLAIRDVEFVGDFYNGSCFTGTYLFDSLIEGLRCRSAALGIDVAWHEGLSVRKCTLAGGASIGSAGISTFTDLNTRSNNVATGPSGSRRSLVGGMSNNYLVEANVVEGFDTGIRIDGVNDWRVIENTPRNCRRDVGGGTYAGILVQNSAETVKVGLLTKNGRIAGNIVSGNGSSMRTSRGGGVVFSTSGQSITNVIIHHNKIHDNLHFGIAQSGAENLSSIEISDNDSISSLDYDAQINFIEPKLQTSLGPQLVARNNRLR